MLLISTIISVHLTSKKKQVRASYRLIDERNDGARYIEG